MDYHDYVPFQGPAKLATEADKIRDDNGYTNPYLHRRVDSKEPSKESGELKPRTYKFTRQGYNQLQVMTKYNHDENSVESEIP